MPFEGPSGPGPTEESAGHKNIWDMAPQNERAGGGCNTVTPVPALVRVSNALSGHTQWMRKGMDKHSVQQSVAIDTATT